VEGSAAPHTRVCFVELPTLSDQDGTRLSAFCEGSVRLLKATITGQIGQENASLNAAPFA
jgi:hypothetical protein